jgi:hypothetical protein
LGTTGILLVSSALLLFVVGAVVAFNGGSLSKGMDQLEGLIVDRDQPLGLTGPALAAAEAAPSAGSVASPPPTPSSPPAAAPGGSPAGSAPSSFDGGSGAVAGAPVAGGPPPLSGPSTPRPSTPRRPRPSTIAEDGASGLPGRPQETLGEVTGSLTGEVGRVVDGVDPRLGQTVESVGTGAGGLVDGLSGLTGLDAVTATP